MKKLFILAAMSIYLAASATLVCAETPDEIMKTAVQLYQNADYDLAAEQFKKYVSSFPADPHVADALDGLAESDFARGSVRESLDDLRETACLVPGVREGAGREAPPWRLPLYPQGIREGGGGVQGFPSRTTPIKNPRRRAVHDRAQLY